MKVWQLKTPIPKIKTKNVIILCKICKNKQKTGHLTAITTTHKIREKDTFLKHKMMTSCVVAGRSLC
jgi:hypothetical protein